MQYRLRTLLILLSAWLMAALGAVVGILFANQRISAELLPSADNVIFAIAWGLALGTIPSLGLTAVSVERAFATRHLWYYAAACSAIAMASACTLYIFAVSTAAI
jgi:hypothetical protein